MGFTWRPVLFSESSGSFHTAFTANSSSGERDTDFVGNGGVCRTAHLAPGISWERSFSSEMKARLWCRSKLGNPAIKMKCLAPAWFSGAPGVYAQASAASSSLSEINAAANPSRFSACQPPKKTIKGCAHRSSCSSESMDQPVLAGPGTVHSLGNGGEGGTHTMKWPTADEVEDSGEQSRWSEETANVKNKSKQ